MKNEEKILLNELLERYNKEAPEPYKVNFFRKTINQCLISKNYATIYKLIDSDLSPAVMLEMLLKIKSFLAKKIQELTNLENNINQQNYSLSNVIANISLLKLANSKNIDIGLGIHQLDNIRYSVFQEKCQLNERLNTLSNVIEKLESRIPFFLRTSNHSYTRSNDSHIRYDSNYLTMHSTDLFKNSIENDISREHVFISKAAKTRAAIKIQALVRKFLTIKNGIIIRLLSERQDQVISLGYRKIRQFRDSGNQDLSNRLLDAINIGTDTGKWHDAIQIMRGKDDRKTLYTHYYINPCRNLIPKQNNVVRRSEPATQPDSEIADAMQINMIINRLRDLKKRRRTVSDYAYERRRLLDAKHAIESKYRENAQRNEASATNSLHL